ncbi:ATP-binding protein [Pseudomonas sp. App30]|uniref:sensor histidine kinase n=1 Tax=Pseudomonas sp. App30 TaxID=3068990 RepID=UPI003A7FB3A0
MTPPAPKPSAFRLSRWNLQRKLILAFWLVSVVPTMIASELAATTLAEIFDSNVRVWLQESTKIVEDEISEILRDNARVAQLFLRYARAEAPTEKRAQHQDKLIGDIADAMGIDVVALIRSRDHKVVFSTAAADVVDQISLAPDAVLQTIHNGSARIGTVVSTFPTQQNGEDYQLLVATFLDASFLTSVADVHTLDLRLYLSSDQGYAEVFSSQRFENHPPLLPQRIEQVLRDTKSPTEQFTSQYSGLYRPLLNDKGNLQGVVFSGLLRHSNLLGLVNQSNLFVLIFLLSSALSLGVGTLVTRRFTRPMRALSEGVRAVTAGDYSQQVEVLGNDELAELGVTFNHMTKGLQALQHLEAQMRRRDRLHTMGEVAMGLAHEIRNPLGIIKTATQLLHRRAALPEADMRHLEYVISEVTRINELITEFLDFAKPSPPIRTVMSARALLEDILGFCAPELATHDIHALIEDQAPGATLYADSRQLKQACLNLVLNAIDAMPDGGHLVLGIGTDGANTRLSVEDDGQGISSDLMERIFNPFVTTKASGTGLGLAKVFSIMENHDGRVECISTPGQGATFNLYIPAREGEPA